MLKFLAVFLLISFPAFAGNPGVIVQGNTTAGDVPVFVNNWTIKDGSFSPSYGITLGTSASATNPQVQGDATTGFFQDMSADFYGDPPSQTVKTSVQGVEITRTDGVGQTIEGNLITTGTPGSYTVGNELNLFLNASYMGGDGQDDPNPQASGAVYIDTYGYGIRAYAHNNPAVYPLYAGESPAGADTFQIFASGDAEYIGNMNNPVGGLGTFQNYFLQSEAWGTSPWTQAHMTVTNNTTDYACPNGLFNATKIVGTGTANNEKITQVTGASYPAGTYTVSFWLKSTVTQDYADGYFGLTGSTVGYGIQGITTDWQRYRYTTVTGGTGTLTFTLQETYNGQTLYACGAQVTAGSSADLYYKTTTTAQTTTGLGVYSNNYLQAQQGIVLGAAYTGTYTPPNGGMIAVGSVGIGTSSPVAGLDSFSGFAANGTVGVSCAAGAVNILTIVVTGGIITHC